MSSLKEVTIETIRKLPEDCSVEDIMYRIHFVGQVLEGLEDAEKGRTISTKELFSRVEQWEK